MTETTTYADTGAKAAASANEPAIRPSKSANRPRARKIAPSGPTRPGSFLISKDMEDLASFLYASSRLRVRRQDGNTILQEPDPKEVKKLHKQLNDQDKSKVKRRGIALFLGFYRTRRALFEGFQRLGVDRVMVEAWNPNGTQLTYDEYYIEAAIDAVGWQRRRFHDALRRTLEDHKNRGTNDTLVNELLVHLDELRRFEIGGTSLTEPPPQGGEFCWSEAIRSVRWSLRPRRQHPASLMADMSHVFDGPDFEINRRFVVMQGTRICPKTKHEHEKVIKPLRELLDLLYKHGLGNMTFKVGVRWNGRTRWIKKVDPSMFLAPRHHRTIDAIAAAIREACQEKVRNTPATVRNKQSRDLEPLNLALVRYKSVLMKAYLKKKELRKQASRASHHGMSRDHRSPSKPPQNAAAAFDTAVVGTSLLHRAESLAERSIEHAEFANREAELAKNIMALLNEARHTPPPLAGEKKDFVKAINATLTHHRLRIDNQKAMCTLKVAAGKANPNGTLQLSGQRPSRNYREGFSFRNSEMHIVLISNFYEFLRDRSCAKARHLDTDVTTVRTQSESEQNPQHTPV